MEKEKPKTHADIRREDFQEHGRLALAIADRAMAQIDDTLSECGILSGGYINRQQPEVSLISYSRYGFAAIDSEPR
jgi:hypothetical protein